MKIKIDYEKYNPFKGPSFASITLNGKTLRSCLLSAFDKLQLYSDANDIIEEENGEGKKYSDDELLDILIEQSGDGADYIFTIKDLDTGKILYTDGGPDEDTDEFESEYDDEEYYDEEDDIVESKLEEERSDDIYDFITELYNLRKESIANEGEYGLGNLVFKEFRNLGYLDNLRKLRKEAKSKELSLEEGIHYSLKMNTRYEYIKELKNWLDNNGLPDNIKVEFDTAFDKYNRTQNPDINKYNDAQDNGDGRGSYWDWIEVPVYKVSVSIKGYPTIYKKFKTLAGVKKFISNLPDTKDNFLEALSDHKSMSKEEFEQFKKDHPEYTFDKKEFGTIILKDGKQIGTYLDKFEDIWMEE